MNPSTKARPARHAGAFYEADPQRLRNNIEQFIDEAQVPDLPKPPVAFVSPHAGYAYSGPTAGHVYRYLRDMQPERVLVFAPSHHSPLRLASVWEGPAYATPLGEYPIDTEIVDKLRDKNEDIIFDSFAETQEHALEVQVPFLQVACPDAKMIPVIVGTHQPDALNALSTAMLSACQGHDWFERGKVAFIASSDGYHGYSSQELEESDSRLVEAIKKMDKNALFEPTTDGHPRACGVAPISLALDAAQEMSAKEVTILNRTSSGELMGHRTGQWIVGYIAAAIH